MSTILNPIEQVKPIEGAKSSYGFVSSKAILDVFQSKGWEIETVQKTKVKSLTGEGYQKHLVWLKNANLGPIAELSKNNESIPRLCLVNSHDSSSSVMIFLGVLRIACLNQLATGNVFRFFRAVHSKNVTGKLGQGVDFVTDGIPELINGIQRLQSIELSLDKQLIFAKKMIDLRLENVNNVLQIDYNVIKHALRAEDNFQDAYTVMNRMQELVIRGGIPYVYEKQVKNSEGLVIDKRIVYTKTRKIASIPTQLKLNKALFEEIEKLVA